MPVSLHPDAAKRLDQLGDELRKRIREVDEPPRSERDFGLYPAASLGPQDILDPIQFFWTAKDASGNEIGRIWKDQGRYLGLLDDAYHKAKDLSTRLLKAPDFQGRVGIDFLLDTFFDWLKEQSSSSMTAYLMSRCREVIKEQNIWIPLFCVYCTSQFSIGTVTFRPLSDQIMKPYFEPEGRRPITEIERQHLDKLRSQLQGTLAACVTVTAEAKTAQRLARAVTDDAIALLRFLSPVNCQPGVRSYCLPLGREGVEIGTELLVSDDRIRSISRVSLECGPIGSDLDGVLNYHSDILARLHGLASDTQTTKFRRQLYDALLLYSRNSVTCEIADKLVFILVALESILLKDHNEPIAKNIGERMAFLIGDTLNARKAIVATVDHAYRLRSAFIHHGNSINEVETVAEFLRYAWETFRRLLDRIDRTPDRLSLIQELEERKLT